MVKEKSTPMLDQYHRLKQQNPDALLLFRLGDFYELFEEDAILAAPVLDVQLTSRDGAIPMCGVPHHAINQYLRKLVDHGYIVAIAEQMEDPRLTKGLVDREVVRTVSPGTFVPEDSNDNPRLAVLYGDRRGGWGLAVAEVATGQVYVTESEAKDTGAIVQEWDRWQPSEYLTNVNLSLPGMAIVDDAWFKRIDRDVEQELSRGFGTPSLSGWGLTEKPRAQRALLVLWRYVEKTQHRAPDHLRQVHWYQLDQGLELSPQLLTQLDIVSKTGPSLYNALNETVTPMGAQLLKLWLERPLRQLDEIARRHQAIVYGVANPVARRHLREILATSGDLAKCVARLNLGYGAPRDLAGIRHALIAASKLAAAVRKHGFNGMWSLEVLDDPVIAELLGPLNQLEETLPARFDDGGLIRDDADPRIGELRRLLQDQRESMAALEAEERERTGIRNLKIGYHRTFGYFFEVTRGQTRLIPDDWHRRQTMTNAERFTSERLRALEQQVDQTQLELAEAETNRVQAIMGTVLGQQQALMQLSQRFAEVDVLFTLAEVAEGYGYVSPKWVTEPGHPFLISGMRHPVLERITQYVPNDLAVHDPTRTLIITGPNMGGKSTYMRAVALNLVLAHMGSLVAAEAMSLPLFDGIYARIGADDNIMRGQSTFMVEMEEMAWILRHASTQSLVILDELGRGTSTFDGMALARAVLERLAQNTGPIVLFATHYHELTDLQETNPCVANLTVEVLTRKGRQLVFTHRVLEGIASQSYGIDVAQMAGLPQSVIARARHYLEEWENALPRRASPVQQVTLFGPDPVALELRRTLAAIDVDELSPRDAWQWIAEWHARLQREGQP